MEEVGEEVEIGELLHIREYIGKTTSILHSIFMFTKLNTILFCNLVKEKNNKAPTNPDSHQVGVEWIHINDLLQYRIYPKELRKYIIQHVNHQKSPVY